MGYPSSGVDYLTPHQMVLSLHKHSRWWIVEIIHKPVSLANIRDIGFFLLVNSYFIYYHSELADLSVSFA